jgi:hypothetical protein
MSGIVSGVNSRISPITENAGIVTSFGFIGAPALLQHYGADACPGTMELPAAML